MSDTARLAKYVVILKEIERGYGGADILASTFDTYTKANNRAASVNEHSFDHEYFLTARVEEDTGDYDYLKKGVRR